MSLLRFDQITLEFGDQPILIDADLSIEPGERICLIGRNGAGKSTTLKLISGELDADRGEIVRASDLIVQMDCDFSHSPTDIPRLLEHIGQYDVVVGSRYVPGGRTDERWRWGRRLLSWWANSVYTRWILGCRVKDTTAGFKCWRRETLIGIDLGRIHSQGYVFQVEMAYVAERLGYRVLEIPIYFEDRRVGQSKMAIPVKLEAAMRVWELRSRHRHLRPEDRLME